MWNTAERERYWAQLDDPLYRQAVWTLGRRLGSDGCTGVADWYLIACYDHDIAYRTGLTLDGRPLTRAEADRRFRWAIQHESRLGRLAPMAWWRWIGVRLFGYFAWGGWSQRGERP